LISVANRPLKSTIDRFMNASVMTVVDRSYSRQIGATSCDSETVTSGNRVVRYSPIAR
jgi:hypothetical protein